MGKLEVKAAAITGGDTGIGKSTATLFAREGARIAINYWSENAGKETATEIKKLGGEAHFIEANVSEPDEIEKAIGEAARKLGTLHVLP
ncbi:MAG: 3-oxoacyl-[acyl-carrier-protein] reductase FabG, partial [Alphaproteobacteria bacterium MarineAlpha9_Bin7]